jgi:hypothetical protein
LLEPVTAMSANWTSEIVCDTLLGCEKVAPWFVERVK